VTTVNVQGFGAVNFPDGMTPEQISAAIERDILPKMKQGQAARQIPPPEPVSGFEKALASLPSGLVNNPLVTKAKSFVTGMADPVVGTAQLGANMLPDSTGIPQKVNQAITEKSRALEAERGKDAGFDFTRMAGNALSPVNLAIALKAPMAATTLGRAAQGAGIGAGTAAMAPVENAENGFAVPKAVQIGTGAVTGGVMTPVLGKVADFVTRRINVGKIDAGKVKAEADALISDALKEVGQKVDDLPRVQYDALRQQVADSLKSGKELDAAALLRKKDFESLGMESTLGQITRDPMQFAKEKNLRNVAGVGEPLSMRFDTQRNKLAETLRQFGGGDAAPPIEAGRTLAQPLAAIDKEAKVRGDLLYQGFRDLAPDVKVADPARFSNTLLQKLDEAQVQSNLSADWSKRLNDITKGDFPLTPATLEQMYRNAGEKLRGAQGSEKKAYALVKSAIDDEMSRLAESFPRGSDAALAKGSLDLGRKEVAGRYGLREALPAVEAAADGTVPPDTFVKKFVFDAPTDQVKKMAALLRKESPEAFQEAKRQVGAELERAAFGTNPAGDNKFQPKMFADALRKHGSEKLGVFFSPEEIAQMKQVSRVGAYMESTPNNAGVNYSNTGSAIVNAMGDAAGTVAGMKFPGLNLVRGVASAGKTAADNNAAVKRGLAAAVPMKDAAALTPAQRRLIAEWLAGGAGATGLALAPGFRPPAE